MRFQNKKISARATALALVLGVVGVLVTALPAFAAVPTHHGALRRTGAPGTPVTITGTGLHPCRTDGRDDPTGEPAHVRRS